MHSISVILIREKDCPKGLRIHKMEAEIVAAQRSKFVENLLINKNVEFIKISTDYFGGCGEQDCIHYNNDGIGKRCKSINQGLKMLGVVPTQLGYDEFDTVGLGNYRSNDKFKFNLLQDMPETLPNMTAWFKHLEKINK